MRAPPTGTHDVCSPRRSRQRRRLESNGMALGNGVAEAPATHLKGALFALGSPPRGALLGTAQRHRARRPSAVCARCAVCPTPSPASAAATTRAPRAPSPLRAPTHPPRRRGAAHAQKRQRPRKKGCERALEEPRGRESALQPCPAAWHAWSARVETPPWLDSPHRGAKSSRQGGHKGRPLVRLHLLLLGPLTWEEEGRVSRRSHLLPLRMHRLQARQHTQKAPAAARSSHTGKF